MGFEDYDKEKLINSVKTSVLDSLDNFDKLQELDNIEFLHDFKCIYVYHPEVYAERIDSRNYWRTDADVSNPIMRDFEVLMRIIELKTKYAPNFADATKFFDGYCEMSFPIARVTDYIYFIKPHTSIDPVVFKLSTGLHLYEMPEISLYELIKKSKEKL